ncbi:MAG: zinc-ribbon domain-containing protein, partial [Erysipelotrichales bacterium]|nr:zinc-ribbon domain-containing protein [Erysipelotrichales bacterium]
VKNIDISPKEVTCQSGKSVWWRCKNGHEWKTTIHNRFYGTGCPICYKNKRKK